jgi:hypothetical protein
MEETNYSFNECSTEKYAQFNGKGIIVQNNIYCRKGNSWDECPAGWSNTQYKNNVSYYCHYQNKSF